MRASYLMPLALISDPCAAQAAGTEANSAQILGLLQSLNAELLANKSATDVLEKWCADHRIANVPKIIARRIDGPVRAPSDQTRARLKIDADTKVEFRNVALVCGDIVLSVAQNWYVPERLTPEMNTVLTSSETPFGKVIAPLNPTRQTVSSSLLWSPFPKGWEMNAPPPPAVAGEAVTVPINLFEHRAILSTGQGVPIAEVVETYQRGVLAFGR